MYVFFSKCKKKYFPSGSICFRISEIYISILYNSEKKYIETLLVKEKIFSLIRQFYPFFKYCVVGVLGTGIDVGIVFFLVEFFRFNPIVAAFFGFLFAVINNFFLNKIWTFQNTSSNYRKLWIKFFLVSSVGLGLTIIFMMVFWDIFGMYYIFAKLLTSVIVLLWNFSANKFWTFTSSERQVKMPENFLYDVSIVIPAYNEENRISNTVFLIDSYRRRKKIKGEIIVVSDGSTDETEKILRKLKKEIQNFTPVVYRKNHGKGFAVKKGIDVSQGKYILLTDADGSTPIEEYEKLIKKIQGKQIAIGSRYMRNSKVKRKQPSLRIFIGRFGNALIRLFLIDDIVDTQCGFKLFEHRAAKEIFCRQKVKRFGFDVEALVIAESLKYKIIEVPVSWFHSSESRFRPIRDAIRTAFDLAYIKLNLWSGRYR